MFTEVLSPTRSDPSRAITWEPCPAGCPCVGVLGVSTRRRKPSRYAVTELPPAEGGRLFRVRKPDGTEYDCLLAGPASSCTCAGHSYASAQKADRRHGDRFDTLGCVHLDALAALIGNGWLPHPGENPDADAGPTEAPDLDAMAAELVGRALLGDNPDLIAESARYDAELAAQAAYHAVQARPLEPVPF